MLQKDPRQPTQAGGGQNSSPQQRQFSCLELHLFPIMGKKMINSG